MMEINYRSDWVKIIQLLYIAKSNIRIFVHIFFCYSSFFFKTMYVIIMHLLT